MLNPPNAKFIPVEQPAPPRMNQAVSIPTRHMEPFQIKCSFCQYEDLTEVRKETSLVQYLLALVIALAGGWICCLCLIPLCIKSLKVYNHYC